MESNFKSGCVTWFYLIQIWGALWACFLIYAIRLGTMVVLSSQGCCTVTSVQVKGLSSPTRHSVIFRVTYFGPGTATCHGGATKEWKLLSTWSHGLMQGDRWYMCYTNIQCMYTVYALAPFVTQWKTKRNRKWWGWIVYYGSPEKVAFANHARAKAGHSRLEWIWRTVRRSHMAERRKRDEVRGYSEEDGPGHWLHLLPCKVERGQVGEYIHSIQRIDGGSNSKESACMWGDLDYPQDRKSPRRREWLPMTVTV